MCVRAWQRRVREHRRFIATIIDDNRSFPVDSRRRNATGTGEGRYWISRGARIKRKTRSRTECIREGGPFLLHRTYARLFVVRSSPLPSVRPRRRRIWDRQRLRISAIRTTPMRVVVKWEVGSPLPHHRHRHRRPLNSGFFEIQFILLPTLSEYIEIYCMKFKKKNNVLPDVPAVKTSCRLSRKPCRRHREKLVELATAGRSSSCTALRVALTFYVHCRPTVRRDPHRFLELSAGIRFAC